MMERPQEFVSIFDQSKEQASKTVEDMWQYIEALESALAECRNIVSITSDDIDYGLSVGALGCPLSIPLLVKYTTQKNTEKINRLAVAWSYIDNTSDICGGDSKTYQCVREMNSILRGGDND